MLVKENHINHIAIDTCKLFIIFVQLFFTVEIVGKRRKMLDNVCAIFQHFCTYKPLNISTVKGNKCWILIISILWTILYRNEMEGKMVNLIRIDTVWNSLTKPIWVFFFWAIFLIYIPSLIWPSLFHFLSKSLSRSF